MRHIIIYLPGLGDRNDGLRRAALQCWHLFGVDVQLLPMLWDSQETYEQKYKRASRRIEQLLSSKRNVTIIGESAGATIAIRLYAQYPQVNRLITLCGVAQATLPVSAKLQKRSPAFEMSVRQLNQAYPKIDLQRYRDIRTFSAIRDSVVNYRYSRVTGANNHRIWAYGHITTITLCLTILSPYIIFLATKNNHIYGSSRMTK